MTVIKIPLEQAASVYGRETSRVVDLIALAASAASHRLKAYLVKRTDELGITDRGTYKNGFKVQKDGVTNVAPHAGIVELGARPHKLSIEAVEALAAWCRRKLGIMDPKEAMSAAWAIAKTIEKEGQKPRYVMQDALPKAKEFFEEEFKRLLEARR